MDFGVVGLLAIIAIVLGAFWVARPRAVASLDELLATLTRIAADTDLTVVQKRHMSETLYRGFENRTVSLLGVVEDVFPNGAIAMRTSSSDLPALGFELEHIAGGEARAITKGRSITLRHAAAVGEVHRGGRFAARPAERQGVLRGAVVCGEEHVPGARIRHSGGYRRVIPSEARDLRFLASLGMTRHERESQ